MQTLRPDQPWPLRLRASLVLILPDARHPSTEIEGALDHLLARGFDGTVVLPDPTQNHAWTHTAVLAADVVVIWVPAGAMAESMSIATLAQTFGEAWPTHKLLYGRAIEAAPRTRALDQRWRTVSGENPEENLGALLDRAMAYLGDGAEREGGHASVPLAVWRQPSFQRWLAHLHAAGNALRSFELHRAWPIAPDGHAPLEAPWAAFAARAGVWDAREQRAKDNEVFIARGDAVAVAAFACPRDPKECAEHEVQVVLVQELRQAVSNPLGRVVELPGGSSFNPTLDERGVAQEELFEEAGLHVDADRLIAVTSRQMAATLLLHSTQLFALRLTDAETRWVEQAVRERTLMGTAGDHVPEHARHPGERILLAFPSLAELRDWPLDWSARGMIAEAWDHLTSSAAVLPIPNSPS